MIDTPNPMRRLNCVLVEVQLHAGTPAYRASADVLARELLQRRRLLAPAVARLAPALAPEDAMAEIVPDLLARIDAGTFHWFTLRYLKTAVLIRVRQLRRDLEAHRSLDDEAVPEPAAALPLPAPEFSEAEVRGIYRRFLHDLSPEERQLLRLARRAGRSADGSDDDGRRQGWQKALAERLGRPPCWVTRHLDALFLELATQLQRPDLRGRKRRIASPTRQRRAGSRQRPESDTRPGERGRVSAPSSSRATTRTC